ncbi:hypothetical protein ACLOJK_002922 [Asimina triloba]
MGLESTHGSKMQAGEFQEPGLKALGSKDACSRHKRSLSYPDKGVENDDLGISPRSFLGLQSDMGEVKECIDVKKKQSPVTKHQSSLKQEILQLERRLQDQFTVRRALEKALGYTSSSHVASNENLMPKVLLPYVASAVAYNTPCLKSTSVEMLSGGSAHEIPTKELIKEIAVLELEVMYLEQHLLSLYRKAFNQQISSLSPSTHHGCPLIPKSAPFPDVAQHDVLLKRERPGVKSGQPMLPRNPVTSSKKELKDIGAFDKLKDPGVQRSHSELSQRAVPLTRTSLPMDSVAKALRTCHSQPLSFLEPQAENSTTNLVSLAEHLGTSISDHVPETPNRLSEDAIRCMGAIYCKLSEPPIAHHVISSSPSSFSSMSAFSPQNQCGRWSPHYEDSSSDIRLDGSKRYSGLYTTMVEVPWICGDGQRLEDAEPMLKNFRSLVHKLEKVDPRRLKHDEKLAFWINIHNALAAYNIGGQTISADAIQSSILGCRTQRPGQWLRTFLYPRMKFKSGDDRQSYAIDQPEPLLHFALCSGNYSDPAVRVYTAKRVFQELDAAKEEFIQATIGTRKEQKLVLPKIVEAYAKDSGLSSSELVDMVQYYLPERQRKAMQQSQGKLRKNIEWVPHNFSFRYLIPKEMLK